MRAAAEISFRKKITTGSTFQRQGVDPKTRLLCNIFNLLNELNLSLQGEMTTVFKLADKVAAFKAKLELWGWRVNRGIFDMFQTLAGILEETEPGPSFSQLLHDHLSFVLKSSSVTFQPQKTHKLRRNGSVTHL